MSPLPVGEGQGEGGPVAQDPAQRQIWRRLPVCFKEARRAAVESPEPQRPTLRQPCCGGLPFTHLEQLALAIRGGRGTALRFSGGRQATLARAVFVLDGLGLCVRLA